MILSLHVKYMLLFSDINAKGIFWTDFRKILNTKSHENPSSEKRIVTCMREDGRTDRQTNRQDEANSRFSHFCENAENSRLVDRLLNV
jgi:hypothetical protein